jgi:O-antigen/teichoic acid export membrane protein
MTSRRAEYAKATGAGLLAKIASISAGLASLWLVNQILEKEEFGAYSFTIAVLGLLSILAAAGLDQAVLYRLSRIQGEPGRLAGGAEVTWVLRIVLLTGIGTAVLAALGAVALARESDLPGLESWFLTLSIIVPLAAVGSVYAAWHQAQKKVHVSLVIPRLNEVSLAALFLLAWLVAPTPSGVAFAAVTAAAVPMVAWLVVVPRNAYKPPRRLPQGDSTYGMKMTLTIAADRGVRRVDLLMVGVLATATLAADYALAARLVALTTLGSELLGAVLTPRMGRYLESGDHDGLAAEYDLTRSLALALGLGVAVLFVGFGKQLLAVFGDFAEAWPVLLILCAAFLVKIGFGSNGRYLNMSGRASWNLFATILLLLTMSALNLILIPSYGATGAALGTLASFAAINTLQSALIWWKDRFPTMHAEPSLILIAAASILLLASFEYLNPVAAAIALAGLSLVSGRHGWPVALDLIGGLTFRSGRSGE